MLVLHIREHEQDEDSLRPRAQLIKPDLTPLEPLPPHLPSFLNLQRPTTKPPIPKLLHQWLGKTVTANLVGHVPPGSKPNAARPSRITRRLAEEARRLAEEIDAIENEMPDDLERAKSNALRMTYDEYEPWHEGRWRRGPKFCDDLNSKEVSRLVRQGLVFYGSEDADEFEDVEDGELLRRQGGDTGEEESEGSAMGDAIDVDVDVSRDRQLEGVDGGDDDGTVSAPEYRPQVDENEEVESLL